MMQQKNTADNLTGNEDGLPVPPIRCFSKSQAAQYLGIGVTLLTELHIPCIKFGRRAVYDRLDLDAWLEEYKHRGRARKENLWLMKQVSTEGKIPPAGGLVQPSQTAKEYAKALGLKTVTKPRRISPS